MDVVSATGRRGTDWRLGLSLIMGLALVFGLLATGLPRPSPVLAEDEATVDPELQAQLADEGEATFWVVLREQAELSSAAAIDDWEARGEAVVDELTSTADATQSGIRDLLTERGVEFTPYWVVNTILVTGDDALAEELAARPEVAELRLERTFQLPEPPQTNDGAAVNAIEWGVERINAPDVWDTFGTTGEGIVVANIDSGVQFDHPALVGSYRGALPGGGFDHNYNWFDPSSVCGNPSLAPCDNNGHGTHTMGTMVGDDGGSNQIGVAPGATWIAAKGCETNNCSESALLAAGQWVMAPTDLNGENPDTSKRPHIVNNSWGNDNGADDFYRPTVQAWVAAGIFPTFSNGNAGPACGTAGAPASYPESFGVGGFDINGNVYNSSSRGPSDLDGGLKPQISAPAVNVRSSIPGNGYGNATGTSMAAPHVSGTVALMWSAAPTLVGELGQTMDILAATAIDTDDTTCGGTPENNNVWGEGRLDAFAAVDAAPKGPTGTLAGIVTDAATGDPIEDATVTVSGAVDRTVSTGEDGAYSLLLPVGDYDATASAFGYGDASAAATVTADATATLDFALDAVDAVTVSGVVNDGSGHGWPVYARVSVEGTPLSTWTDPFTGAYAVEVPANAGYTFAFSPDYPGYGNQSHAVDVADADVTLDVALEVGIADCRNAPGYRLDQPAIAMVTSLPAQFQAYFDDRGVTVDFDPVSELAQVTGYDVVLWGYNSSSVTEAAFQSFLATTDAEGAGVVFLDHAFTTWNGVKTLSRFTGQPESVTTSTGGVGQENLYEVTVEHPILEGFEVGDQIIHEPDDTAWLAWFDGYSGDGRQVIANAGRTGDGILGSGIGVDERPGNRHALLSMHAQSATRGPSGWSDDSDRIFWNAIDWVSPADSSFTCVPIEGGLVLGTVTDQNTGAGINGATVTSVDAPDETATTVATPDDTALGDGFYWMFSSLLGSHEFTAAADRYVEATQVVDVAADAANRADFALAAGLLSVDPTELSAEMALGASATRSFVITNEGSAPAELELVETGGSFVILGDEPAASGASPSTADEPASGEAADPNAGDLAREKALADGGPALSGDRKADRGASATPDLPRTAQDEVTITHSASQTILAGNSVACSPDNGLSTTENGYLRTFTLTDFGIGGDFNVTGVSFGIEAIDPAQTVTVKLYTLEGAFVYDNLTPIGSAEATIAPQSLSIVTVPVEGTAPAGSTLVVEIDAPDMSGIGRLFIGSNDEGQTAPSYLRSASCGLVEPTDTADIGFPNMQIVMNVTGQVGGDVPWLEVSPTSATLDPGESMTVTVGMDSAAAEENQPGTYGAGVGISHDTPYDVPTVGVEMVVTPPNNWGKLAGTVTGVACDGSSGPLSGATVQLNGKREQIARTTNADGGYARWMPTNNSPVTVIVAYPGYSPQVDQVRVSPKQTTVADFELRAICSSSSGRGGAAAR